MIALAAGWRPRRARATNGRTATRSRHGSKRHAAGQQTRIIFSPTATLNAAPGVSGAVAFTFGCSGTSGTGSNCVDIDFSINTGGSYGTTASLATCGANNLQGGPATFP